MNFRKSMRGETAASLAFQTKHLSQFDRFWKNVFFVCGIVCIEDSYFRGMACEVLDTILAMINIPLLGSKICDFLAQKSTPYVIN